MKMMQWMGLVALLVLGSAAHAALREARALPAQQQLLSGQEARLMVSWQVAAQPGHSTGAISAGAQVVDARDGSVLMSVASTLSSPGAGPFRFSEVVSISGAQVRQWWDRGVRRALLVRNFADPTGGMPVRAQVVLRLASSGLRAAREDSGGELQVQRMSLSFSDNQRVKVVPADSGDLYGKLVVAYSGNGLLQGRWQVAEPGSTEGRPIYRTLTQVRRYLSAAQQTTLQSPPLPHDRTGQYRLRFCVSNPELVPSGDASVDPGCPIEGLMVETVYEVLGRDATDSRQPLQAQPQQGVVGAQTRFSWQPVPLAVVYRLQLFALTDRQAPDGGLLGEAPGFVAGMLLPAGAVETRLSPLMRSKMTAGHEYLWRVTAHDADGRVIGRSQEWKVRYQP